jgi:hypothetical protein
VVDFMFVNTWVGSEYGFIKLNGRDNIFCIMSFSVKKFMLHALGAECWRGRGSNKNYDVRDAANAELKVQFQFHLLIGSPLSHKIVLTVCNSHSI